MSNDPSFRTPVEEASRCRQRVTRWWTISIGCIATIILSVAAVWGEDDSYIGAWLERAGGVSKRVNPGHMMHGMAIVQPDGEYRFYPWFEAFDSQVEDFARERELKTDAIDVLIFISYRARPTGWYGLATYYRPLFFDLRGWTIDGDEVALERDLRAALHVEMVDQVCALEYPNSACPYVEVLEQGKLVSLDPVPPSVGSYIEFYSLKHIRWQGWFHNAFTVLALLMLPLAVVRSAQAMKEHRRWKVLIQRAVCPKCGYDLRLLPQPRCPECGTEFGC
jgi:hypothetical protein